jgi:hypothetical protein
VGWAGAVAESMAEVRRRRTQDSFTNPEVIRSHTYGNRDHAVQGERGFKRVVSLNQ